MIEAHREVWRQRGIDPVTLEVIRNSLQTLVDEMAYTLGRTCASQLVREVGDYSTGLCDAEGNLLALSITQPANLATICTPVRNVLALHGDAVQPGDVYILNDPYYGGTHLNDIHIVKPCFADGQILAWVTTKAHHIDVGGRVPGSMAFENTEIYQDGLRIPPLRLYERGRPDPTLFKMLELNVRYPDVVFADINAQVTALAMGEKRLEEVTTIYGADSLPAYFAGLLDHGETLARARIAAWPDGTAEFEDYCDLSGRRIVIHTRVTVAGEEVHIDFAGTSPQVPAAVNMPPDDAVNLAWLVICCCLGDVPINSGTFRSVHVSIPPGSILNPRSPGPCSERGLIGYRVSDAVFGAMAQFVPEGVTAAGEGGSYVMRISGTDAGGHEFLCLDLVQGTWGARAGRDGVDGVANMLSNHTNTPVETLEANFPIRVETHTLVPDTGGPGRFRGGLAIERSWRYLGSAPGTFRSRSDRSRFAPYGLFGGHPGAPSQLTLERQGDEPKQLDGKAVFELRSGDLVRLRIAGGGGWGPPTEREPALVSADVAEGKVSPEQARGIYRWGARAHDAAE